MHDDVDRGVFITRDNDGMSRTQEFPYRLGRSASARSVSHCDPRGADTGSLVTVRQYTMRAALKLGTAEEEFEVGRSMSSEDKAAAPRPMVERC